MYCYSDKEKDELTKYFDLYEAEFGISRRLGQCWRILEGRLDGHSLIEMIDWFGLIDFIDN